MTKPVGVLLVGSVPLRDAEEVMLAAGTTLGRHLRSLPDGETGERTNWIRWQYPLLAAVPGIEPTDSQVAFSSASQAYRPLRLDPSVRPESLRFSTHFDEVAIESYAVFARLQAAGAIPERLRFQVSLPTPFAVVGGFFDPNHVADVLQPYEAALAASLARMMAVIPAERLAIQWDTAIEFSLLEGLMPHAFPGAKERAIASLSRLADYVPAQALVGFHLCYGDAGHKHFIEPRDTARMVEVANQIIGGARRSIDWIHMPVPRARDDAAYFEPLRGLRNMDQTRLYLGLLHATDGMEGAVRRIRTAQQSWPHFGIGTECGLGRRAPQSIPGLLALHAQVADPWA